jgi:hypothetical protein
MEHVRILGRLTYMGCLRDRLLHVIFAVVAVIFFFVPALSLFSMRQVQS